MVRGSYHRRRKSGRTGIRGQVAILFALVFTFMFVLFCFVVDFGHLVNAKINLQIAADTAAYAGAAWQARTLNKISMVNYKIRQDLKEMAMRLNVTHLRHNRNFPRGDNSDGAHSTEPFICQQAHGYRALSGLRYANDTNLCRNASPSVGGLPPIVVPPVIAAFDPFAVAIAAQIRKIAEAANQECRAAAEDNRVLAQHLINVYTARSQFHGQQIDELVAFMNEIGAGQLSDAETHPVRKVAFETARRNLSATNRLDADFRIQVLGPSTNEYIRVIKNVMRGSVFFINFNVVGDGCVGRPSFLDFDGMLSGITKDQPVITYFAVKLTSRPKLFFMPAAWADAFPVLEAFAAAKPFGGRIGPDTTADELVPVANRPGNNNRMINFRFRPDDNLGIANKRIMSFLDSLHPFNAVGRPDGNQNTGWPEPNSGNANLRAALETIRAPTVFDALLYSIHPDPNRTDSYLEQDLASRIYPDHLEVKGPDGQDLTPTPESPNYFQITTRKEGFIQAAAEGQFGGGPYGNYATEGGSSHSVTLGGQNAQSMGWANANQIHSGWHPPNRPPRIGYSVKFIGFDALMRTMIVKINQSGGRGPIENKPSGDDANLNNIYH